MSTLMDFRYKRKYTAPNGADGQGGRRSGKDGLLLSQALGNTAIVLAAVVPWSIAGSVPLEAMGASALAIPFSFFLFAAPVCDWLCHRKQFQME